MLHIRFGTDNANVIINPNPVFNAMFNESWLKDAQSCEIVKDIDKSIVEAPYCIKSPVLGQIQPFMLQGGTKTLLMMKHLDFDKNPTIEFWAQACGKNCEKWIYEIQKTRDIKIRLSNMMVFRSVGEFKQPVIVYTDSGQKQVKNSEELLRIEIENAEHFDD